MRLLTALTALCLLPGCAPELTPGQWGTFRYFGQVRGEPPMRLIPPMTDRDGNVYVLYGAPDRAENTVYVGHADGGWSGGCQAHRGTDGVHGFLGRDDTRAWFWSGDALARVSGADGSCREVLSTDPVTGTEIDFLGVAPYVFETPSRTRLMAMVRGASDAIPYVVRVDLDQETYFDPQPFSPASAEDVFVVGTGADAVAREAIFVVAYGAGAGRQYAAQFFGEDGQLTATASLTMDSSPGEYDLQGFVQVADDGLAAALLTDGSLLIFNRERGGLKPVTDFTPLGIVLWDGALYVTGLQDDRPVVSALDAAGSLGPVQTFSTAQTAANTLNGGVTVLDERSDPSRNTEWEIARSAIGDWPFLTPWPLDVYTTTSTGWLAAGPGYSTGTEPQTAVAFAPVGFSIP